MLPGTRTDDGALYVTDAPLLSETFNGGVLMSGAGVVAVTSTLLPQVFANGLGLRQAGQLCIAYGGVIANYEAGLPFTADGRLVCQLNQPISPGDSFVGGVRVGPLGGVYVVDIDPPVVSGFSSGFSSGFGA
jgi:hypothetical protein